MTLRNWYSVLRAYAVRQEGQTMAEYGVVLAVITLGVITAIGLLAGAINTNFTNVTKLL